MKKPLEHIDACCRPAIGESSGNCFPTNFKLPFQIRKEFTISVIILFVSLSSVRSIAQSTVFRETVGSYQGIISVTSYTDWFYGNYFTHTVPVGSVTVTNAIAGSNYSGASGGTPVRVPGGSTWIISGLNTSDYETNYLSFGIHKTGHNNSGSNMHIEVSSDGVNYTTLSWPLLPTGPGTGDTWHFRDGGTQVTGIIPSATNLRIRFRNTSANTYHFDDIELKASFHLPLNLLDFNAQKKPNGTELNWVTVNEQNVSHFKVERSDDGSNFNSIAEIKARNTGAREAYKITDYKEPANKTYYRLLTVDIDGKTGYSKVISVQKNTELSGQIGFIIAEKKMTMNVPVHLAGKYRYQLFGVDSRPVQNGELNLMAGSNILVLPSGVKSQMYILHITNRNVEQKIKFIYQN